MPLKQRNQTKDTRILSFLVEHFTIKMDIGDTVILIDINFYCIMFR